MFKSKLIYLVILKFSLIYLINGSCQKNSATESERLKNDLLCGYETSIYPGFQAKKTLQINVTFILKYYTYDTYEHSVTIQHWIFMFWKDDRLKWVPNDYENIVTTHFSDDEIWTPDIINLNTRNPSGNNIDASKSLTCLVNFNGGVSCFTSKSENGLCVANLLYYPFDQQTCDIMYGLWGNTQSDIQFDLMSLTGDDQYINLRDLTANPEWKLLSASAKKITVKGNSTFFIPIIKTSYNIQRRDSIYWATILIPAIILVMLTLTTAFMSFMDPERLRVGCLNLLCHVLYVQHLFWLTNISGDRTPKIVTFFRDSMILSTVIISLSILFKSIAEIKSECPTILTNLLQGLTSNRLGQLIFTYGKIEETLITDGEDETEKNKVKSSSWIQIAILLNNLTIIIYFITYFILFIGFIP